MLGFVIKTQNFDDEASMTFSVDWMKHLVKRVRLRGPLCAESAFVFEAGNGMIKSSIKAPKEIPHQICRALALESVVSELEELVTSSAVCNYCFSLTFRVTLKYIALRQKGSLCCARNDPIWSLMGPQ